jgi:hypothetical protein
MHGPTENPNRRTRRQDGLALPTVLFLGVVMFLVVTAVAFRGVVGVHQADDQRRYNEALQIADGGVDKALFELIEDHDYGTMTPATAGGTAAADGMPSPGADEREWALNKATLKLAAGATSSVDPTNQFLSRVVKSRTGEWAVVKPAGESNAVVYAVGYVPSRANATRTRVLRIEYDFPPFNAINAILTGGNLKLGGNASISGSAGSIHTNGNFDYQGNSWNVSGAVAASGTFPASALGRIGNAADSGGGKAAQEIPDIDPSEGITYGFSQYDLCPDGSVRGGPANPDGFANVTGTPCGGPVQNASGAFKGWTPTVGTGSGLTTPTTWKYQTSACNNGVFFVKWGTAEIKGNPGKDAFTCQGQPWAATILVSTKHPATGHCPHYGGDIDISGTPSMRPHPSAGGILLMAGRDFKMLGNASGGGASFQGSISVHEQFDLSGNMTLTGNIIANDQCSTTGSPIAQNIVNLQGSSSITFNSPVELPLGKQVRITRWTEL